MTAKTDTLEQVETLDAMFRARVEATPENIAYRHFDQGSQSWQSTTWSQIANEVGRWQAAMKKEGLQAGDRIGIMMRNRRTWVVFDQAALGLGLITVPVFADDRPENVNYILHEANVKILFVDGRLQWRRLEDHLHGLNELKRIISSQTIEADEKPKDSRIDSLQEWLFGINGPLQTHDGNPDDLVSIVYTSGTTGKPKGVMLSHRNIMSNVKAISRCDTFGHDDVFLSFLPLSHMLERTAGYYMPMYNGCVVAYARSIPQLAEDLQTVKPTVLISVPRIYERVYGRITAQLEEKSSIARKLFMLAVSTGWKHFKWQQGRASWSPGLLLWPLLKKLVAQKVLDKLGGRLRMAVCGGAPLNADVAKLFIGLGLPVVQGYGLTETSPVISVNRLADNIPASIGTVLDGIEVKIGEQDELLCKGPNTMLGYWNNDEATRDTFTEDGWLKTGDKARIDDTGHIYITGRLKEIIVLANGEKVPPADMELAITMDNAFDQVMVLGEGKGYLTALVVLNPDHRQNLIEAGGCDAQCADPFSDPCVNRSVLRRISDALNTFPGYAQIRQVTLYDDPWTVDNGLLTPTLKMKRQKICERFADDINKMYSRHE